MVEDRTSMPGIEGPASLYPERPDRDEVPMGLDGLDEDGRDVGPIENGVVIVVTDEDGEVDIIIGPFRLRRHAEVEVENMIANGTEPHMIDVVPMWRPFATGVYVQLRATAAEEERYTRIMATHPAHRSVADEAFIEATGNILFAETTDEGTSGYDTVPTADEFYGKA